jgi:hypothetical protein
MNRLAMLALCAALACAGAGAVDAQTVSWSPRTGDVWIDDELGQLNDYGRRDRDYFVDDIVSSFGAPRYVVKELMDRRDWQPGDVYYACALAYQARRPCGEVARAYDEEGRGQGWGVVARRLGIKPGSAEFHAMKDQLGKSKGRYGARPPAATAATPSKDRDAGEDRKEREARDEHHGKDKDEHKDEDKDKGQGGKGRGKSKGHGA